MDKALEILNRLERYFDPRHQRGVSQIHREIQEAIAEIKALQAAKTCNGCVYFTQYGCNVCAICKRHPKCIDRYEPKETL